MARETKFGLFVAFAFLLVVGGVLGYKLMFGEGLPWGEPEDEASQTASAKDGKAGKRGTGSEQDGGVMAADLKTTELASAVKEPSAPKRLPLGEHPGLRPNAAPAAPAAEESSNDQLPVPPLPSEDPLATPPPLTAVDEKQPQIEKGQEQEKEKEASEPNPPSAGTKKDSPPPMIETTPDAPATDEKPMPPAKPDASESPPEAPGLESEKSPMPPSSPDPVLPLLNSPPPPASKAEGPSAPVIKRDTPPPESSAPESRVGAPTQPKFAPRFDEKPMPPISRPQPEFKSEQPAQPNFPRFDEKRPTPPIAKPQVEPEEPAQPRFPRFDDKRPTPPIAKPQAQPKVDPEPSPAPEDERFATPPMSDRTYEVPPSLRPTPTSPPISNNPSPRPVIPITKPTTGDQSANTRPIQNRAVTGILPIIEKQPTPPPPIGSGARSVIVPDKSWNNRAQSGALASAVQPMATPPVASPPQVESFDVEVYIAKPGDTFASISKAKYQDEKYQKALGMFNKLRDSRMDSPQPNRPVYLPPAGYLERRFGAVIPGSPAFGGPDQSKGLRSQSVAPASHVTNLGSPQDKNASPGGVTRADWAVPTNEKQYRVQPNDTIYSIAKQTLGNGERWTEIARLNKDRLRDINQVQPGMVLRLPADAQVDAPAGPQ